MTKKIIDVTAAIIVKQGKILAARRGPGKHLQGYWEFPGGKVEENESPETCLERELFEELSISSRVGAYIGQSVFDYGDKIVKLMAYEVDHLGGDFKLVDHDEICWLDLEQIDDLKWAPADIPLIEQFKSRARVVQYYSRNAIEYCEETSGFDVGNLYSPFLENIKNGAHILDLGCGSGRDSKAFREMGYEVTSVDVSPEIAAWASTFTGHPVIVKSFLEMDEVEKYDGVWASASLLHCHEDQLLEVVEKVMNSLKLGGVAYLSFKWGESMSIDDRGRYFSNLTVESLGQLLKSAFNAEILKIWDSETLLRDKPQRWVNAIIQKSGGPL